MKGGGLFMFESVEYDLTRISYGRRGCFLYAGAWNEEGYNRIYACALLAGLDSPSFSQPRFGKLFPIILAKDGREIPYTAKGTPVCITLECEFGKARICLQKGDILRIEAVGVEVIITPSLAAHEIAKTRNDSSWEIIMHPAPKLLLYPIRGTMEAKATFNVIRSMPGETRFTFRPDDAGIVDIAVHLYISNGRKMECYPEFNDCIADIECEFFEYLKTVPELPEKYKNERIVAAYLVWSHIMAINGNEVIYMNKGIHRNAFSWQQCYQAIGQYKNPEFAWKLLNSMFRYQDDYGMLPDCVNDISCSFAGTKPPLHGLALNFLFQYTDFDFVPYHDYRILYEGISRLVYWWLSYRDTDNDGIAQYDSADESGWDDSSMFSKGVPAESPDLSTYLILAMDSLSKMAKHLGRSYEEREWKDKADRMMDKMLKLFWNGEKFITRINETHEVVECGSIASYLPLLLGKRLPREIADKMASDIAEEGKWLTPYGLAGEMLDSPNYRDVGWLAGPILAPPQMLICLGLRECGHTELARKIAERYCAALKNSGFAMIMNAKTGEDVSEGRWSTRYPNRMSWTGMTFLVLGSLFLNE